MHVPLAGRIERKHDRAVFTIRYAVCYSLRTRLTLGHRRNKRLLVQRHKDVGIAFSLPFFLFVAAAENESQLKNLLVCRHTVIGSYIRRKGQLPSVTAQRSKFVFFLIVSPRRSILPVASARALVRDHAGMGINRAGISFQSAISFRRIENDFHRSDLRHNGRVGRHLRHRYERCQEK